MTKTQTADGISGQDRQSYSDEQDRESYKPQADFTVSGGGSVFLISPETAIAEKHLRENASEEAIWYNDGSLAVEHRYVDNLIEQLKEDGFSIA